MNHNLFIHSNKAGFNHPHILLFFDCHIQSCPKSARFYLLNAFDSILNSTVIPFVQVIMILGDSSRNILMLSPLSSLQITGNAAPNFVLKN